MGKPEKYGLGNLEPFSDPQKKNLLESCNVRADQSSLIYVLVYI